MRFLSLQGKLTLVLALVALVAAGVALALRDWLDDPVLGLLLTGLLLAFALPLLARALTARTTALFRALAGSVTSFKDGDFSFSIATDQRDELAELVQAHNELGRVLRDERQGLFQRVAHQLGAQGALELL